MHETGKNFWLTPNGLAAIGLIAAALYFLFNRAPLLSNLVIFGGFVMLASAWRVLHAAQQQHDLATEGIYARMRHPQYAAFIVIMFGFLLQWPTLPTVVMFPILVYIYVRLARREEQMAVDQFGDGYRDYMTTTPAFIPVRKWPHKASARCLRPMSHCRKSRRFRNEY